MLASLRDLRSTFFVRPGARARATPAALRRRLPVCLLHSVCLLRLALVLLVVTLPAHASLVRLTCCSVRFPCHSGASAFGPGAGLLRCKVCAVRVPRIISLPVLASVCLTVAAAIRCCWCSLTVSAADRCCWCSRPIFVRPTVWLLLTCAFVFACHVRVSLLVPRRCWLLLVCGSCVRGGYVVGVVVRFDLDVCASACVAVRAAVRTVAGAPFLPLPSVRVRMDYVHARVVRYCDSRFFGALVFFISPYGQAYGVLASRIRNTYNFPPCKTL